MSHAQGNRPHILRRRSNATLASFCRSLPLYQWPLLLFFLLLLSQLQSEVRASSSSGSCLFPAVDKGGQIKDGLPPPSAVTSPTSLLSMLFGDQQPFRPSEDRQSAQQQIDPFSLQECACEPDWTDAFCGRMAHYEKMPASKVPSVCVCRQVTGPRQCRQFLSRCFQQPTPPSQQQKFGGNSTIQIQQHRPLARSSKCSCCFNQPDAFCNQIDCLQMRPQFDAQAKTSCRCFAPAATKADREDPATMAKFPPDGLCTQFGQHWPRWAEPQQPVGVQGGEAEDEQQALSFAVFSRPSSSSSASSSESGLTKLFRSSAPYARLVSLLLLALLASLLLALAVCFWSHWRRLRRGRRKAKVEAEQQPATLETDQQAEAALLDEIALGAESAVERATEEGGLGIERNGGGVRLQEATV